MAQDIKLVSRSRNLEQAASAQLQQGMYRGGAVEVGLYVICRLGAPLTRLIIILRFL